MADAIPPITVKDDNLNFFNFSLSPTAKNIELIAVSVVVIINIMILNYYGQQSHNLNYKYFIKCELLKIASITPNTKHKQTHTPTKLQSLDNYSQPPPYTHNNAGSSQYSASAIHPRRRW